MVSKTYIIAAIAGVLLVQGLVLYWLGHSFICPCGYVKLWDPLVRTSENSQHLFDWYSFSHVISGCLLYAALWVVNKKLRWPVLVLLLVAIMASAGWEIFENTHFVIHRYQANTMSVEYYGDSIINSLSDTFCVAVGFLIAFTLPVWATVALVIGLEITATLVIHDSLLLNIIMLVYPVPAILGWQTG